MSPYKVMVDDNFHYKEEDERQKRIDQKAKAEGEPTEGVTPPVAPPSGDKANRTTNKK